MNERDIKFGRLIAIANVLGRKVFDWDAASVASQHLDQFRRAPVKEMTRIHERLIQYSHKFGADELALLDMFGEIMASIDISEFNDEPLNDSFLQPYYAKSHSLRNIMGVDAAAKKWGLTPGYIKNLCADGKVIAEKVGKTWILDKNQPNPKHSRDSNTDE